MEPQRVELGGELRRSPGSSSSLRRQDCISLRCVSAARAEARLFMVDAVTGSPYTKANIQFW
jgi:hypothetical protein